MPFYDFLCEKGHHFEIMCSTVRHSEIGTAPPCTASKGAPPGAVTTDYSDRVPEGGCGAPSKQMIVAPLIWIVNEGDGPNGKTRKSTVLNTPSSLGTTAGTVHSHGPKMATKYMSGPYGVTKPEPRYDNPIARNVQPEALSKHRRPK